MGKKYGRNSSLHAKGISLQKLIGIESHSKLFKAR